jgi:hypothetical protein
MCLGYHLVVSLSLVSVTISAFSWRVSSATNARAFSSPSCQPFASEIRAWEKSVSSMSELLGCHGLTRRIDRLRGVVLIRDDGVFRLYPAESIFASASSLVDLGVDGSTQQQSCDGERLRQNHDTSCSLQYQRLESSVKKS